MIIHYFRAKLYLLKGVMMSATSFVRTVIRMCLTEKDLCLRASLVVIMFPSTSAQSRKRRQVFERRSEEAPGNCTKVKTKLLRKSK